MKQSKIHNAAETLCLIIATVATATAGFGWHWTIGFIAIGLWALVWAIRFHGAWKKAKEEEEATNKTKL